MSIDINAYIDDLKAKNDELYNRNLKLNGILIELQEENIKLRARNDSLYFKATRIFKKILESGMGEEKNVPTIIELIKEFSEKINEKRVEENKL